VDLVFGGTPTELPSAVELAGYRIVQEALTNVLKHAGPATAAVTVSVGERAVVVEVTDDGRGSQGPGSGHGLVGMRERVGIYGGTLTASRREQGGFAVRAELPVSPAAVLT
jgi:signal transduction histidine kinase